MIGLPSWGPPVVMEHGPHVVQVDDEVDLAELHLKVDVGVAHAARLGVEVEPGATVLPGRSAACGTWVEIGVEVAVEVEPGAPRHVAV